jgi:hypothetical protein
MLKCVFSKKQREVSFLKSMVNIFPYFNLLIIDNPPTQMCILKNVMSYIRLFPSRLARQRCTPPFSLVNEWVLATLGLYQDFYPCNSSTTILMIGALESLLQLCPKCLWCILWKSAHFQKSTSAPVSLPPGSSKYREQHLDCHGVTFSFLPRNLMLGWLNTLSSILIRLVLLHPQGGLLK